MPAHITRTRSTACIVDIMIPDSQIENLLEKLVAFTWPGVFLVIKKVHVMYGDLGFFLHQKPQPANWTIGIFPFSQRIIIVSYEIFATKKKLVLNLWFTVYSIVPNS